jgi:lycopene elongase/hydratase (dihydrobisanhydrobacterioruberin-forming)
MEYIKFILKISRPRFWLYLAGPLMIGFIVVESNIYIFFNPLFYILLFYFLLPANIYLYGVNDYFDLKTDLLNPKKDKKELRLADIKKRKIIKIYSIIFLLISLVLVLFLSNFKAQLFAFLFLFLATFYSAPPLRFKSRLFLDFISNILYVLPAFIAYSYLSNNWPSISIVLAVSFWSFAMHLFSAIPDIEFDKRAKVITSAVFLGEKKSLFLCFIFWLIFASLIIYFNFLSYLNILFLIYPLIPLFLLIRDKKAENIYWQFPFVNAVLGFLSFWYIILF